MLRRFARRTIQTRTTFIHGGKTSGKLNPWSLFSSCRLQHSGSIYLHHTTVGPGINSAAVTLGLVHSLSVLCPGMGYFRPIDSTSHGGHRSKLVKDVYNLPDAMKDMQGCSQKEAIALITRDRVDDLVDIILKAYENYKRRHDFVVVEGTSLKDGSNTTTMNGIIASALGSPAMLVTDAVVASGGSLFAQTRQTSLDWSSVDWQSLVLESILEHERILRKEHVEVVGALVYRAPRGDASLDAQLKLREKLREHRLPLAGAIPMDGLLESLQVQDVQQTLNANVLYGQHLEASMSTQITQTVVGTLQLEDLLEHLAKGEDHSKGSMVITHVSRPDILLGLLGLHDTLSPISVAAIVLTGGSLPSPSIDQLVKNRFTKTTLPVLVAGMPTYETCLALSKAQAQIHPTSTRKIERAQVLFDNHVDMQVLKNFLFQERAVRMNPKLFQYTLFQKAKAAQMHIVLPEGEEPRTVQAAGEIIRRGLAKLTLLGNKEAISAVSKRLRVNLDGVDFVNPLESEDLPRYAEHLFNARKHKGLTLEQARDQLLQDVNFFGTTMVALGEADGMVSGAIHTTANTVRPALQVIKTLPETPIVSSVFFMCLPDKVLVYGDCAINTDPTAQELASIAISSADTARSFGIDPRVAMLSYATGDSNQGPLIQKVINATQLAKSQRPDLAIEGPLQYDAAVNPETAKTKMKGKESAVAGKATVLIFPDLNTGNNTYKAVQQSTGAIAMGPLLQGLRKPVNDLSRGCTVQDIVTTIALTAVQAYGMQHPK